MALPAHSGPWPLIQFRNHFSQTVGFLGRVISPSQGRYLRTAQTSMPQAGFEPTIPASERAKTAHSLDRAATVIGYMNKSTSYIVHANLLAHPLPTPPTLRPKNFARGPTGFPLRIKNILTLCCNSLPSLCDLVDILMFILHVSTANHGGRGV
jgi:hypothetical protein